MTAIPLECICGSKEAHELTEETCTYIRRGGLRVVQCDNCGVIRQLLPEGWTERRYLAWYSNEYPAQVYTHAFEHDLEVARKRVASYLAAGVLEGRALDVGCGNGAFMEACEELGIECWGVDPHGEPGGGRYKGTLRDVGFPTANFKTVVVHDVLEHMLHPREELLEIGRILDDDGVLIIDFPKFHSEEGAHHWKPVEHVWYFNEEELQKLLEDAGFRPSRVEHPIPGKLLLHCRKISAPSRSRPRILIPPGIGDTYWVMCKMESFLRTHNLGMPEVWIASTRRDRDRALDYVRRHPFVYARGYHSHDIRGESLWKQAYIEDNRGVFEGAELGGATFDYFLSANGGMRWGRSLDELICEGTNWYPQMFISNAEHEYGRAARERWGPYVVVFFTDHGMYRAWLEGYPARGIAATLGMLQARGYKIVLTGAVWDDTNLHRNIRALCPQAADLVGRTTLKEFLGLLRYAAGCFGFCGGNTILATVFKVPTVIVWNSYFDERFWVNACPPDSLHAWYEPVDSHRHTPEQMASKLLGLMSR